jgi:hypothetical protein
VWGSSDSHAQYLVSAWDKKRNQESISWDIAQSFSFINSVSSSFSFLSLKSPSLL